MDIITTNAAIKLFELAEDFSNQNRYGWKCIHFNLHDRQKAISPFLASNLDLHKLKELISHYKGTAFLLEEGEVFLVFKSSSPGLATKIHSLLYARYEKIDKAPIFLFSVMKVCEQWDVFYRLCERRYVKTIAEQEQMRFVKLPLQREELTRETLVALK